MLLASSQMRATYVVLGVRVCEGFLCLALLGTRPSLALPLLLPSVIVVASQQESCARVLLFRGANKDVRNYNSQTAFQVQDV